MQNIINNFKNSTLKQKIVFLGVTVGGIVLASLLISFIIKLIGNRISYDELETKLAQATEKYLNENPNDLPTKENPTSVISAATLIENKYIKALKKYVKDASCTANINVYYNQGKYDYQPFLTCNDFKTETFLDVLKKQNEISSFGEGLYELNNELVFRGERVNNYVKFADELWRIVKVNDKGEFIIILNDLDSKNYGVWDNRYNTEAETQKGINNYSLSRALSTIRNTYQEKYSKVQSYLSPFSLCVEKRGEFDITKDGSVECSKRLDNQYIGLLPLYDYMNASLDSLCINATSRECQNYNYLVNSKDKWWTATGDPKNTFDVYYVSYSGQIVSEEADVGGTYRYILALNKNILYKKGSGTESDPYEIR